MNTVVSFNRMDEGTREDYVLLDRNEREHASHLPDRIMDALRKLDGSIEGYKISRLEHSLQTATRAEDDGADIEMVIAALLHDLGDDLAPVNHSQLAASIVRPYVRDEVYWVVKMHGLFQMPYYAHHLDLPVDGHLEYREHRWFESCTRFCRDWDQTAFDPDYPTKPLEHFEPMVREVFTRQPFDPSIVKGTRTA